MQKMDEDQVQEFEEDIGMRVNPEKEAQAALRAYQEAAGIVIENPDAPVAPDAKWIAQADDEEMGGYMGGPRRGRR